MGQCKSWLGHCDCIGACPPLITPVPSINIRKLPHICVFVILYANQPRRIFQMRSPSNTNGFIVYLTHISMFSFSILCMCLCTSVTEYLRVWMTWYSMHYPLLNSDPGSQLFTCIFHDPRWQECIDLLQPYLVQYCSHLPTYLQRRRERLRRGKMVYLMRGEGEGWWGCDNETIRKGTRLGTEGGVQVEEETKEERSGENKLKKTKPVMMLLTELLPLFQGCCSCDFGIPTLSEGIIDSVE